MGLFDKIFQSTTEETKLTQQEAFAGMAIAMDGAGALVKASTDGLSEELKLTAFACAGRYCTCRWSS